MYLSHDRRNFTPLRGGAHMPTLFPGVKVFLIVLIVLGIVGVIGRVVGVPFLDLVAATFAIFWTVWAIAGAILARLVH